MLGVSRALARVAPHARVGFAAFNEEEDGIVGSEDFAAWWTCGPRPPLVCAHILEIVGYASFEPGSQRFPLGPWRFLRPPHVRDFIGVLGNRGSKRTVERVVTAARESTSGKLLAARTLLGLERFLPDLDLSDPVRLWQAGIPAVLWTDTAFYRKPAVSPRARRPRHALAVVHGRRRPSRVPRRPRGGRRIRRRSKRLLTEGSRSPCLPLRRLNSKPGARPPARRPVRCAVLPGWPLRSPWVVDERA